MKNSADCSKTQNQQVGNYIKMKVGSDIKGRYPESLHLVRILAMIYPMMDANQWDVGHNFKHEDWPVSTNNPW